MCNCKRTEEFGDYSRMVIIYTKNGRIQVDKCLEKEIKFLNNECNIKTIASCCGHNKACGFIAVKINDVEKMEQLGYEQYINPNYPDAKEFFYPKYL